MKEKLKTVLLNSIIILGICFLAFFLIQAHQNYNYYSVYTKEELARFFSVKDSVLWITRQALYWSVRQMIIFVPILIILEKTNIKNAFKILITICLTGIISFIYLLSHLTITF